MRKSAILIVLTLALTSVSTAALIDDIQLQWSPGDSVVQILGLSNWVGEGGIQVSSGYNASFVSPFNTYPETTSDALIFADGGGLMFVSFATVEGLWFEFGIDTQLSEISFDIFDYLADSNNPVGTVTVPEPMTLFLFGLGGLFLRRRSV